MDDSYGLAELHEQLLIIMDDIDRVCRAHDIKYTLSDGSLLGAIRHKGFIPWDDDMDVRMVREEFEKFKVAYANEKREDFIIGHPCNLATYSVINPNYEIRGMEKRVGTIVNPWVSILPMDVAPRSEFIAKIKATKMRLLSGMMGKPPQYANFSKKSRRLWDITAFMGGIIGHKTAEKWYQKSCVSLAGKNTGVYASYTTNTAKAPYRRYPQHLFDETEDIVYENRIYKGITHYDEYLRLAYGDDYMTPISPDQRKPRHMVKEKVQT